MERPRRGLLARTRAAGLIVARGTRASESDSLRNEREAPERFELLYGLGDAVVFVKAFDSVTGARAVGRLQQVYFLVDRSGGKGISITFWESEDALNARVERANRMREEATDQAGGSIQSVDNYEVALTVG